LPVSATPTPAALDEPLAPVALAEMELSLEESDSLRWEAEEEAPEACDAAAEEREDPAPDADETAEDAAEAALEDAGEVEVVAAEEYPPAAHSDCWSCTAVWTSWDEQEDCRQERAACWKLALVQMQARSEIEEQPLLDAAVETQLTMQVDMLAAAELVGVCAYAARTRAAVVTSLRAYIVVVVVVVVVVVDEESTRYGESYGSIESSSPMKVVYTV